MAKKPLGRVKGDKGDKGDSVSGVTLKSGTHAPGTTDTYNVNLDNGEVAGTFEVFNGQNGEKGDAGPIGPQGIPGKDATVNGQGAVDIVAGSNVELDQKEATITIKANVSKSWTCELTAAGWTEASDTFGGISATYKQQITCAGMTADTDITAINFAGGDFNACASYQWYLRPGAGICTFWSPGKPSANFQVKLTAVRE